MLWRPWQSSDVAGRPQLACRHTLTSVPQGLAPDLRGTIPSTAIKNRLSGIALRLFMQVLVITVAIVVAVLALAVTIYVVVFLSKVLEP